MTTTTKRVTGPISEGLTKRVLTSGSAVGGTGSDTWGGTWGDTWGLTWFNLIAGATASPSLSVTRRVSGSPSGGITRRV